MGARDGCGGARRRPEGARIQGGRYHRGKHTHSLSLTHTHTHTHTHTYTLATPASQRYASRCSWSVRVWGGVQLVEKGKSANAAWTAFFSGDKDNKNVRSHAHAPPHTHTHTSQR